MARRRRAADSNVVVVSIRADHNHPRMFATSINLTTVLIVLAIVALIVWLVFALSGRRRGP